MVAVEGSGLLVLGMNEDSADARDIGCCKRSKHRIAQETRSETTIMVSTRDCQASKDHDRNRVARQPFAQAIIGFRMGNLANH